MRLSAVCAARLMARLFDAVRDCAIQRRDYSQANLDLLMEREMAENGWRP